MKKMLSVGLVGLIVVASMGVAFAGMMQSPSEVLAGITGKTTEEVVELRGEGSTFGHLAVELEVWEEFKQANLEARKARLEYMVEEGKITQEKADEILAAIEDGDCGTPGEKMMGQENRIGFGRDLDKEGRHGSADGEGNGNKHGNQGGNRKGNGRGNQ
ncbi:MAG: hypothetical protein COA82_06160 [Alkaliphilus sp.]|nr:hypothetical protein [bacterium AH-315-K05]MBN4074445.1 hypothetical protein [bacterium AH-315-E09]PHS34969.1 MAG: hypothetical protein COA82_06160 [Alkaliphilus sp.]